MSADSQLPSTIHNVESIAFAPSSGSRIGVVVCDCGREIARRLDTESLRQSAAGLPGVVFTARETYPCSPDGLARLRRAIADSQLDRVLIAGCAPRLVERRFQETAKAAGLDGHCVEVANVREQCAYVHESDTALATHTAAGLIEMGVARLAEASLPRAHSGRIAKSVMVIGGSLSGLSLALSLADAGIDVILVEGSEALESRALQPDLSERSRQLADERIASVSRHPRIRVFLNARVSDVSGRPGDYDVRVAQGDQSTLFAAGAIVVAGAAHPRHVGPERWYDRLRVRTQVEFEQELLAASQAGQDLGVRDIVMILCAEEAGGGRCSRVCCSAGIRQALRAKHINPEANVTVLFRDLYLGGSGDLHTDELEQAQKAGVTFFRYQRDHPPKIGDDTVDVPNPLTGQPLRVPFDRVVLSMPLEPPALAGRLAAMLSTPQDEHGFMIEPRFRLRPGRYADDGIYVLGGAHQPVDAAEALFQAYVTSARVLRFLNQAEMRVETAVADIDASLCTGCAACAPVCPTSAITLRQRDSLLSLARVEALRCIGCGNCVVACPVKAITLPGWDDAAILAQISAALRNTSESQARVIVLGCEWSAYAAADMAGARHLSYPAEVRIVRLPCSARFDPNHVLWAFVNGADGVFLGACPPGDCHYGAGNLYAIQRIEALKMQLAERGIDSRRLRLEYLPGDDGERFAQAVTDFVEDVKQVRSPIRA